MVVKSVINIYYNFYIITHYKLLNKLLQIDLYFGKLYGVMTNFQKINNNTYIKSKILLIKIIICNYLN